jgi:hypothetical protein
MLLDEANMRRIKLGLGAAPQTRPMIKGFCGQGKLDLRGLIAARVEAGASTIT